MAFIVQEITGKLPQWTIVTIILLYNYFSSYLIFSTSYKIFTFMAEKQTLKWRLQFPLEIFQREDPPDGAILLAGYRIWSMEALKFLFIDIV